MPSFRQRSVITSVAAYRMLVTLYPRSFRQRFGTEMSHVFEDLAYEAVVERGNVGLIRLWFRSLWDILKSVPRERLVAAKVALRADSWIGRRHWRVAFVACMVVAMLVTPSDPLSMLLLGFPMFALYTCLVFCWPSKASNNIALKDASHG